jgi:hypothetical protein
VKRFLALLAGGLGLGALLRRRRARLAAPLGPSPADELRARLAAADAQVERHEPHAEAAAEEPAGPVEPDGRREDVHDRARRAIDELS